MDTLLKEFENYCLAPEIDSGKARSYAKAIQLLCIFWNIANINEDTVIKMKNIEANLSLPESESYRELLSFLERRGQSSYLTGRFIKSALNYFFKFWENKTLLL